jgi:hypothetical protein
MRYITLGALVLGVLPAIATAQRAARPERSGQPPARRYDRDDSGSNRGRQYDYGRRYEYDRRHDSNWPRRDYDWQRRDWDDWRRPYWRQYDWGDSYFYSRPYYYYSPPSYYYYYPSYDYYRPYSGFYFYYGR